jgi:hypothetical protein
MLREVTFAEAVPAIEEDAEVREPGRVEAAEGEIGRLGDDRAGVARRLSQAHGAAPPRSTSPAERSGFQAATRALSDARRSKSGSACE